MIRCIPAILTTVACLAAGCRPGDGQAPAPPPTASAFDLIEASGIAVRGEGKAAVIGGDETPGRLWGVALDDFAQRWELPYPAGTPPVDDVEALCPWGGNQLFVICSQSKTKPRQKVKPERGRLALLTLSQDARRILAAAVHDGLRDELLAHLAASGRDLIENPVALSDGTPVNGGLNVEGLAAWKGQLLVGLRSPAGKGGAIVVPIRGPGQLFSPLAPGARPDFGKPLILPAAAGEGIRDLAADGDSVLALLGPSGEANHPKPRIVRWNPATGETQAMTVKGLDGLLKPEGIALDPQGRLLVVQDLRPPITDPALLRLEMESTP